MRDDSNGTCSIAVAWLNVRIVLVLLLLIRTERKSINL